MTITPPAAPVVAVPLIAPDLSATTLDSAITVVATQAAPFLPTKVRVAIYTVAPVGALICGAVAPVVGGQLGLILDAAAAALAVLAPAVAISHVTPKAAA